MLHMGQYDILSLNGYSYNPRVFVSSYVSVTIKLIMMFVYMKTISVYYNLILQERI